MTATKILSAILASYAMAFGLLTAVDIALREETPGTLRRRASLVVYSPIAFLAHMLCALWDGMTGTKDEITDAWRAFWDTLRALWKG